MRMLPWLLSSLLPGLPSLRQAVPAAPGLYVAGKAVEPSSATTASRPGIRTRRATRPGSKGHFLWEHTATIHPVTQPSKGLVSPSPLPHLLVSAIVHLICFLTVYREWLLQVIHLISFKIRYCQFHETLLAYSLLNDSLVFTVNKNIYFFTLWFKCNFFYLYFFKLRL